MLPRFRWLHFWFQAIGRVICLFDKTPLRGGVVYIYVFFFVVRAWCFVSASSNLRRKDAYGAEPAWPFAVVRLQGSLLFQFPLDSISIDWPWMLRHVATQKLALDRRPSGTEPNTYKSSFLLSRLSRQYSRCS